MTHTVPIEATPLTDHHSTDPPGCDVAALVASVGVRTGAQRVELYRTTGDVVHLAAWWGVLGHGQDRTTMLEQLDAGWFPWSLGHVRPLESLFVQNATTLPVAPAGPSLGELGYRSVLHLPVFDDHTLVGAACVLWVEEHLDWPRESRPELTEWTATALDLVTA